MLKKLALLLLSAFLLPSAVATGAILSNEPNMVRADEPEVLHGYTYTDEYVGSNPELYRTIDDPSLCPTLTRNFSAPSGYVFTLSLDEQRSEEIIDQLIFLGSDLSWIEVTFAYRLAGSRVVVDISKMPSFDDQTPIEQIKEYFIGLFANMFTGYELFKVNDAVSEFTIAPQIEFKVIRENGSKAHLVLKGDSIYTKPFDAKDFVKVFIDYNRISVNSGNATLYAVVEDGFFYEAPSFNDYGWHTDSTLGPEGEQRAFFMFDLYAYDDVPLALELSTPTGFLQMSYPDTPIPDRKSVV